MKLTIDLPPLQSALKYIQKAIPSNPQLPILSSINLGISNSKLTLSATDLYLGIRATVPVSTKKELNLVFPGDTFKDLINSFSADEIKLEIKGDQLDVAIGKSKVRIPIQSAEEYPDFPDVSGKKFEIPREALEEIKTLVAFAASSDQARPILTAVMFNFSPDGLEVVGTDGFRLAVLSYPEITTKKEQKLLIPVKAFHEVCRVASQAEVETVALQVSEELKQIKFVIDECEVYVRLIDGEYPPYKKIIPDGFEAQVNLNGADLREELQRAYVLAKEATNIVKFSLEEDSLVIKSSSPAHGKYEGVILFGGKNSHKNEIAFNANYLLDFLNSVKPEDVEFSMNESLKPARFRVKEAENFNYIVMPFRVNE